MIETVNDFIARKNQDFKNGQKVLRVKDITRTRFNESVKEAWTWHPQSDNPEKVFILERLKEEDGKHYYRFAYWIVGKIGRKAGKWTFAQFCPMIYGEDLRQLLEKAKAEGTVLPGDL